MASRQNVTVRKNAREDEHPSHPFRNFLYFLYTLLNAAAFCGLFWFLREETPRVLYIILCTAWLTLAVFVGLINAMRYRKR